MKPNAITAMMIRSAVKKGLKDIKDAPGRGIRNLVELGEMFSSGHFQKDFFQIVLDRLQDENSAYYAIVERVVQRTDAEILTTFGIDLGYNALAHGASAIRELEAREGYSVPWCLFVDLGGQVVLPPADLDSLVRQGRELGIYSYMVDMRGGYPQLHELMSVMGKAKDCAFVLFLPPEMADEMFFDELGQANNVAPMLDMDGEDEAALDRAAGKLLAMGRLCGGFCSRPQLAVQQVTPELLRQAEALELPFFVVERQKKHHPPKADDVHNRFVMLRENLDAPVVPIDLYGDVAHADRVISGEACLVTVRGDGRLELTRVDSPSEDSGCNIHNMTLEEALRRALPRGGGARAAAMA